MALKFLNKKGRHTGSLWNIENVWKAEQKHEAEQKKLEELRKQIQEERERSEFRLLQEQAGLTTKSERLEFLYDSGLAVGNGSSSTGSKALESFPPKTDIGTDPSTTSAKQSSLPGALFEEKQQSSNDAWRKLHSDPLLLIRQREQEALTRVKNNPIQMAIIRKSDKDEDVDLEVSEDTESLRAKSTGSINSAITLGHTSKWKRKFIVIFSLTILTSSQAILIVWSKRAGKYEYSVTTANFLVEALKCALSLAALARIWRSEGVTGDNRLSTTLDEVSVYPIPAALYLIKNLLQYYIFAYVDAPGYQILKNLNIISTGVLYRIILKKRLSKIQWAAFILLSAGCTTAQLDPRSDRVLQTPFEGWLMAIAMALLSGFAGVYTEAIIKKRPSRNINVQNFWLYVFGMIFNTVAILVQDFEAVANNGFFHGYSLITVLMILNHALSGIAVSMVMKYADNIVKVYSTSVAMLLTALVSAILFGFHFSIAFLLGSIVVSVSIYLHYNGAVQRQQ